MADLNDRLDRLISDQESMRKVLEMAKTILAQRDSAASVSASDPPTKTEEAPQAPDLSSLLSDLVREQTASSSQPENATTVQSQPQAQGLSALAAILPQLMQAMSGQGNLVKQERVTLLRAMRPYLKDSRSDSIERALRMANMTKAASAALHTLGR